METIQQLTKTFYIDPSNGSDENSGTSPTQAWKTLAKVERIHQETPLMPGDNILLKAGEVFKETITLKNVKGTKETPITLSWYKTKADNNSNKPVIIPPSDKQQQCIVFKECSFIQVSNIEVRQGKIYACFGKLTDSQSSAEKTFESFIFEDVYMHNVYVGDLMRASIEFNVLNKNIKIKNVEIKNCEFENITCQAISFNASKIIYNNLNQDRSQHFESIKILNNKIRNTSSTAISLNYASRSRIEKNVIQNSGKFLYNKQFNKKGSSGIMIGNCTDITITKNQIQSSYGETHSSAICLGSHNANITLRYNFSKDNFGGFLHVMGGNSNIRVSFNVSFNDGLRIKTKSSQESTNGRTIVLSDFSGWCGFQNENTNTPNCDIAILNNIFYSNFELRPLGLSFFGKNSRVKILKNVFINKTLIGIEILTGDLIEKICFIDNILTGTLLLIKERNSSQTIIEKQLDSSSNTENFTLTQTEMNYADCMVLFLEKLKKNNLLNEIEDIAQLFEKSEHKKTNLNLKQKPRLYCILCNAPRKNICLMQYLSNDGKTFGFLNDELASDFETSNWEVTSWFSTPMRIILNEKAKKLLNIEEGFSETKILESLFNHCASKVNKDKILFLGEHFIMSGSNMFNYLYEEMSDVMEINSLFLFDDIYKDIKFKLTKRYEHAKIEEIKNLDVNSYVSHAAANSFPKIETLLSSVSSQLGLEHFLVIDFQRGINTKTFNEFWRQFTNVKCSSSFKALFDKLSRSTKTIEISDENCVDPLFFQYLLGAHKQKSQQQQILDLQEIKKFQTKYALSTEDHPLLNFNKEAIACCTKHCTILEALGNFKFFGNTTFIDNGFENSTKRIKTTYYEINLQHHTELLNV